MAKDYTYEPEQTQERSLVRRGAEVVEFKRNAPEEPVSLRDSTFTQIGTKRVSKQQEKILTAPPNPTSEVAILPTGELYPPQIAMRRRLAKAFGPMGWALRPISPTTPPSDKSVMYREYALIAEGRVIATAIGSGKYYESNRRMDYGDVAESIKSDALKRCCKDLNMLSELWDPQWIREWRNEYAVHVFVAEKDRKSGKLETVDRWRRIDAEPFQGELEPVRDSPNQEEWRKQAAAWRAMLEREAELSKAEAARLRSAKHELARQRRDLEDAGGNPNVARRAAREDVIDAEPVEDVKPEAHERDSRPATTHAPRGVQTDDKPFLIKACRIANPKTKTGGKLFEVEMMDGTKYYTFSDRVYASMQGHFAAREKVLIQHESKKAGTRTFRQITEWQVRS